MDTVNNAPVLCPAPRSEPAAPGEQLAARMAVTAQLRRAAASRRPAPRLARYAAELCAGSAA